MSGFCLGAVKGSYMECLKFTHESGGEIYDLVLITAKFSKSPAIKEYANLHFHCPAEGCKLSDKMY